MKTKNATPTLADMSAASVVREVLRDSWLTMARAELARLEAENAGLRRLGYWWFEEPRATVRRQIKNLRTRIEASHG